MNKRKHIKILGLLVIILILWQGILFICTKGINSQLFLSVLIFGSVLIFYLLTIPILKYKKLIATLLTILVLILYVVIILYSPKYTYNQAKAIIEKSLSIENDFKFIDLEIKTVNLEKPYNYFVSKTYIIGVTSSSNEIYYLVSPYDGSIVETNFFH